jgi:hypothetical protein
MKPLVFIAAIFLLLIAAQANPATDTVSPTSGLEVSDASTVPVVIDDLTDNDTQLGLSQDIIEARVNAVLRRNGLKPVEVTREGEDHSYHVHVAVVGDSYMIHAEFYRVVTFNDGVRERRIIASTWARLYHGTWNQLPTGRFKGSAVDSILKQISEFTEVFANEFLKANQK